ncbi:phage major capsid protein [Planomicrobium okeanokoites]|uniref:Phage major capsid protein n=1 Tax=Planomicrobium okeanokoites TaxID=244 RepID=A0ABV7KU09_PLAOK|nr:phage major capsid protein [Planomicrobium okeanokoites]TAA71599.1 phage major capsid protein [Planomicrobium okeanokoites]
MAQTFSPDNVLVYEQKDGSIPDAQNALILQDVIENSKIMQLGVFQEMDGKEKSFEFFAEGPGAYWVGETEKIQTSKPTMLQATMRAHKLAVILPVSREYLQYKVPAFFEAIRPKVAEAFYKKFDEAGILNVANPFPQSVDESAVAAGNVVEGEINYTNILALQDALYDGDEEANAVISKVQNNTALRGSVDANNVSLFDRQAGTVDGITAVNLKSAALEKGTLYAGNFDHLHYGIPFNINYKISEDAQLSTITNADGSPINLFEQEMVALRVTMDVALMITKDEAFAKLTAPAGV